MALSFNQWLNLNTTKPYCQICESDNDVLKMKGYQGYYCIDCLMGTYQAQLQSDEE